MEGFVPVEHRMGWKEWYGTPKQITYNSRLYNDDGTVREEFVDDPAMADVRANLHDKLMTFVEGM